MQKTGLTTAALAFTCALPVAANAEIKLEAANAPISEVIVYPEGARVERALSLRLPAGSERLEITGLTAALDPESLRVSGAGAALRLGSIESRRVFSTGASRDEVRRLEAEIEALEDREAALRDRLAVAERQLQMLQSLIAAAASERETEGAPPPAEHWREMLVLVTEGSDAAYARKRDAQQGLRELERQLEKLRLELSALGARQRESYAVTLALETAAEGRYELTLSYQIAGARWRPLYDARLDSEAGEVMLTQLAEVAQSSGEDWQGVALTLSTTQPASGGALPELGSWFVDLQDPAWRREYAQKNAAEPSAAPQEERSLDALADGGAGAAWAAQLAASEFAAEWRVPGRIDLASDGSVRKMRLEDRSYDVALSAKIFPKLSTAAFLVGELTHDGDAPLLPGALAIYRDGAYVGRQALPLLRPSETQEIAFGLDDRIGVDYRLVTGETGARGLLGSDREERRLYEIQVQNHHARALAIEVLEQLPVPRHEDIEVALLPETSKPSEQDVEGRKGVLAWRWTAEAGERRDIRFGYAVRFPQERAIIGF